MDKYDVYGYYLQIAPKSTDSDETAILSLCNASLRRVFALLKPDADKGDIRIARAAACLAHYDNVLFKVTRPDEPESYKAGDITVKNNTANALAAAKELKMSALEDISDLIEDRFFGVWCI